MSTPPLKTNPLAIGNLEIWLEYCGEPAYVRLMSRPVMGGHELCEATIEDSGRIMLTANGNLSHVDPLGEVEKELQSGQGEDHCHSEN